MRIWGRQYFDDGTYQWVPVVTDPVTGDNTAVRLTQLVQVLKLNTNESPFYAQFGIPAQRSVIQQVFPDYDVAKTQAQFAPYFASLIITKITSPTPTYLINVTTNLGVTLSLEVPV